MVMALHSGPLSQLPSPVGIVPTLQLMQPPTEELPSWRLVRCLQLVTELPGVLQDAALNAPLPLTLRGLGSFGGRVLFLEVAKKEIEYRQEGADPASPGAEDPVAAAVVASTGKPAKATEALACGRNSSSTITERGRPGEGGAAATENAAACVAVTNADGAASESVLQRLLRLQSVVAAHFEELKYNDGGQSFAPHVTVAKVTYKPPGASQWQGKGGSNRDVGDKRIYTNDNGNDNGNGNGNRPQYGTWKSGDGNCGASASEGHRKSIPDQHAGPQRHGALEPTASAAATAAATAAAKATKVYGCANPGGCGEITVSDAAATAAAAATTATNAVAVKSITDEYGNRIIDFLAPASAAAPTLTPSLQRKRQEQQKQQQEQREMEKHNQEHKEYGKPLKNIPRQAYEALLDIDAGCVIVDRIQLCVMGGRTPGNYYQVLAEVKLDGKCVGELHGGEGGSDSSDCCPDDKLAPNPTEAASSGLVPHPQLHTAVRMTGAALALLSTPPR
ncbi:hypothetical protein Vafri_235 [Volvox africanus]|nr:hypothetical protein Vafri_235 [Volvox africanus]